LNARKTCAFTRFRVLRTIACHPEQGWSRLCNGVILFDDTGQLLPGGRAVLPHHPARVRRPVAA